jgi:hypothetical protein
MLPLIGGLKLIFLKHFETLDKDASNYYAVIYFFVVPAVVAFFLVWCQKLLTPNSVNTLIAAFSIFTGLLLNIILIIFAIIDRYPTDDRKRNTLLDHLYANSIYALLTSAIVLIILIITIIWDNWVAFPLLAFISCLVYFGISHFIMTLFMIFTRLYVLLFDAKKS